MRQKIRTKLLLQARNFVPSNAIGSLVLVLLLSIVDLNFVLESKVILACLLVIFVNNVLRYILYLKNYTLQLVLNLSIVSAIGWMTAIYFIGAARGMLSIHSIVALIILAGVASSGAISNANIPKIAYIFIFLTMVVPSFYIYTWDQSTWVLTGVGLSYAAYLFRFVQTYYSNNYSRYFHEEALDYNKGTFSTMLDSIPGIVSLIGPDLKYKVVNQKLAQILNLELENIIDQPLGFFNPDSEFTASVREYIESGCQTPIYYRIRVPDEGPDSRWYLLTMNRVHRSQDVICLSLDIEDLVKLENENETQKSNLMQANKMAELGQIASGIAHEINNPIAIIKGKLSQINKLLTQESYDKDKLFQQLKSVDKTADRISKIIQSILSFSRKSNSEPIERVNLDELINETLEFAMIKIKKYDVRILYEKPEGDIFIKCRPIEISQVILNLISNAADAIQSYEDRWIKIDCELVNTTLFVKVSNSGPKITKELAEKIMQPFFTTKESGKGTGLGLTISSQIMKSYGGTLTIDDNSENTCFVIAFPNQD